MSDTYSSDDLTITHQQTKTRLFTFKMKEECWNKSTLMMGRDPDRWRLDAVGNPVCKALRNCDGPLCHNYDHIVPYSKGGATIIENCQVLQSTVNKYKSNKLDSTFSELKQVSPNQLFTDHELDCVEKAIYGSVDRKNIKQ